MTETEESVRVVSFTIAALISAGINVTKYDTADEV